MKKTFLALSIFAILFHSCEKEILDTSTQASQDHLFAENIFNDINRLIKRWIFTSIFLFTEKSVGIDYFFTSFFSGIVAGVSFWVGAFALTFVLTEDDIVVNQWTILREMDWFFWKEHSYTYRKEDY